ncbi:MAG TPA: oligosaccharide flippase family protein [Acidimicrobiia bacterium]|nr:oligosaccharide flippase family protein [Acidimicrobiia bacterium]
MSGPTGATATTSGDASAAARGSLALTALQTLGRLLAVGFVLVATRHLAPAAFGRYSTASAFVVIGGILADFGTTMVIVRRVSRDPAGSDALLTRTLPACLGLGVASMLVVAAVAVAAGYPSATRGDVLLAALALPPSACVTSLLGGFDGRGLIARRALLTFLQLAVVAGGGVVGLLAAGARGAVVALPAAPVLALVVGAVMARRAGVWSLRVRPDADASWALLRDALPFGLLGGIAALQLRFDVVLLSIVGTAADTARYDLAVRALEALAYLGTVVAAPAIFILSRRLGRRDVPGAQRALDQAGRFLALIGVPVSALLVGLHGPLTTAAFGARYGGAAVPLAIAGGQLWLAFLAALQSAAIVAGDRVWPAVPVAAAAMAVMVGLDLALVPPFGAVGAAAATVAGTVVMVGAFGRFLARRAGLRTPRPAVGVLAAGVLAAVVSAVLAPTGLVPAAAGGLLAYAAAVLASGAVRRADVARLWGLARGSAALT